MTKHTSGPWFASESSSGHFIVYPEDGSVHTVALVYSTREDAAIIEAAPDMLAALRLAAERLEMNNYDHEEDFAIAEIKAVIAKAENR